MTYKEFKTYIEELTLQVSLNTKNLQTVIHAHNELAKALLKQLETKKKREETD